MKIPSPMKITWAAALCGALVLAAGCSDGGKPAARSSAAGGQAAAAVPVPAPDAEAEPAPAPEPRKPAFPLTGMPSETETNERPIMVMVENSPQARPQSGLDEADIVYEILAEGDITRFAAVYQSKSPKTIGPVRSIRPYYVELGDGLDAYIVHAGWSQDAMDLIAERKLAHFDQVYGDDEYYWRDPKRKMPHNLYTSIELIRRGVKDKRFRTAWNGPHPSFAKAGEREVAAVSAQAGSAVPEKRAVIPYMRGYTVSYDYDESTGTYLRSMNGERHVDAVSGRTLSAVNVIISFAEHRVLDKEGRREVALSGPGRGVLLQQGTKRDVTWERKDGLIRVFADGRELGWLPGQTWVQVVPVGTAPSFE
ncbi:DUF3048 domain-containing protein [Paenibacillus flagellatus]|uniref:DUF3048 domain-containing protein n=1 Tax=Paenibacillus flagellatus TaxID=2211139 RepID=A0A2V5JXT9_9BACL|nr:DUF3048 domain-containing protein [Paenibacillus flagellatus]PYI50044.1 DUF3048 domain-containing protein [Paenibacillus flagellatus]